MDDNKLIKLIAALMDDDNDSPLTIRGTNILIHPKDVRLLEAGRNANLKYAVLSVIFNKGVPHHLELVDVSVNVDIAKMVAAKLNNEETPYLIEEASIEAAKDDIGLESKNDLKVYYVAIESAGQNLQFLAETAAAFASRARHPFTTASGAVGSPPAA